MTFQRIHSLDSDPGLSDLDTHILPTRDTASWGPSVIPFCVFVLVPVPILDGVRWYNSVELKEFLASQCGLRSRSESGRVCLMAW